MLLGRKMDLEKVTWVVRAVAHTQSQVFLVRREVLQQLEITGHQAGQSLTLHPVPAAILGVLLQGP